MRTNKILTIIVSKDRPTVLQRGLASLVGEPTDVFVACLAEENPFLYDFRRMFEMNRQELICHQIDPRLCDRNLGIEYATDKGYPYIFFMDDDNIIPSGYLETLLNELEEDSDIIGVSGVIQTYASVKEVKYKYWREKREGFYIAPRGQEIIVDADGVTTFTTKVQVLPYQQYDWQIDVDYFVNSWLQRTVGSLRFPDIPPFGEEIIYTYRLGKVGRLVVFNSYESYHLAADYGGTREAKEQGQTEVDRQAHWLKVLKEIGIEAKEVVE